MTVGLPVYNGEKFLDEAVASILGQTCSDFELVISDNASTDATEEICREFAAADCRVRYTRNAENMGGTYNFDRVVHLARGPYFKWAAHDDVCRPQFLERCVAVLDADPRAVLVFPRSLEIDAGGNFLCRVDWEIDTTGPTPHERFRAFLSRNHYLPMFGVMRTDVLRRTGYIGDYRGSDHVLLAELTLHGTLVEVPEDLFLRREHPGRSVRTHAKPHGAAHWFKHIPAGTIIWPGHTRAAGYLRAINRAGLPAGERWRCRLAALDWARRRRSLLYDDVRVALRQVLRRRA